MIRINLLPVKAKRQSQRGKQLLALFLALLVVEAGVLFYMTSEKADALQRIEAANKKLKGEVEKLEKRVKNVKDFEEKKKELEGQRDALNRLMEGQTGPVKVLDALSLLLTPVDDPVHKLEIKKRGWNPDWDPKRLFLDSFIEQDRSLKIVGYAETNDDLAEFLQRLESSPYFHNVNLNVSVLVSAPQVDQKVVQFDVDAVVAYGPADVERIKNGEIGGPGAGKRRRRR